MLRTKCYTFFLYFFPIFKSVNINSHNIISIYYFFITGMIFLFFLITNMFFYTYGTRLWDTFRNTSPMPVPSSSNTPWQSCSFPGVPGTAPYCRCRSIAPASRLYTSCCAVRGCTPPGRYRKRPRPCWCTYRIHKYPDWRCTRRRLHTPP